MTLGVAIALSWCVTAFVFGYTMGEQRGWMNGMRDSDRLDKIFADAGKIERRKGGP